MQSARVLAVLAPLHASRESGAEAGVILGRVVDHLLAGFDDLMAGFGMRATGAHRSLGRDEIAERDGAT
jgi:hypothetical protein